MIYLTRIIWVTIICLNFFYGQTFDLSKNIPLSAQVYSFKDPGANRYLTEINISFSQSHFNGGTDSKKDTVDIITGIYSGETLIVRGWHWFPLDKYLQDNIKDVFLDQFTFAIDPGEYQLTIEVKNRSEKDILKGEITDQITVMPWDMDVILSSDILISDLISKPEPDQERFIKYGIFVQPYPLKTYSPKKPLLFYFWEIYNIKNPRNKNLTVKVTILNSEGKIVKKLPPAKVHLSTENSAFSLAGQNIMALTDGSYKLQLEYFENDKMIFSKESSNFRIMKRRDMPQVAANKAEIDPIYFAKTEDEIDDEIYFIKYIMNEKTWQDIKNLDYQRKRINLTRFWKTNDYIKETEDNEFKAHYFKLVEYVRENYNDRTIDGVDTDMGRVILVYGKPDYINSDIDDEIARQSVEYWRYNNFQAFFLFVQENFIGPYNLVHSSMRGEIADPKWADYLQSNPDIVNF